ncbi:hypothetical protein DN546_35345, partial [Burkholderia multivorans]
QGNKGLRYELTPPDWSGGIFGASDVSVFRVRAPSECTVANTPTTAQDLRSTPVSAEYSETTDPTIEYWCVSAKLKNNGEVGHLDGTLGPDAVAHIGEVEGDGHGEVIGASVVAGHQTVLVEDEIRADGGGLAEAGARRVENCV